MADNIQDMYKYLSGGLSFPVPIPASSSIFMPLVNSAGSAEMAIDVGSIYYDYVSSTDHISLVERINIVLYDTAVKASKFGGMIALPTGIKVENYAADGTTVLRDFMGDGLGITVKKHYDFGYLAGVDLELDSAGGGDAVGIRWTLERAGGSYLLNSGESIRFTMQDSLGLLTGFQAHVQGRIFPDSVRP